ncbi:MAG: SH3 domain-containing protein [Clostridia bacterium]|nr:SH3 domain-containing protein [Clostridia bacterium]
MQRATRRKVWAVAAAVAAVLAFGTGCGSLFTSGADSGVTLDSLAQRVDQLEAEISNLQSQVTAMGVGSASEVSTPTGGAGATLAVVVADVLNVRQDPDANSQRIGVLMKGAKVTVEQVEGDWTKINFNNTLEGWVASQYLKASGK